MFNNRELNRRVCEYGETVEKNKSKQQFKDEVLYCKALAAGEGIPEEIKYVREGLKAARKRALEFEKQQFEAILENKAPNYPEVFMEYITNCVLDTRYGLRTAVELEIQEIEYILNNFDEYYDQCEILTSMEVDETAEDNERDEDIIVR